MTDARNLLFRARVADMVHLLQFVKIESISPGDAERFYDAVRSVRDVMVPLVQGEVGNNYAAVAAIAFALDHETEEPMEFLRCWAEGGFDALRREWPEAPEEVYIGADPLYGKRG